MKLALLLTFCIHSLSAFAQKNSNEKVLTGADAKKILDQINFDSTTFLRNFSNISCECIDSVNKAQPDKTKKMAGFSECIDNNVGAYQLSVKLIRSMKSDKKKNEISLDVDKNSDEYQRYYFQLERWLKDSCKALNEAIASNDEAREKSYSKNPEAIAAYNKGLEFLRTENYADGIPWFEKAVKADPEFAFAWDNLGICYRRTGKLDKAEAAYKSSLKADPGGKTALQNLAVVYQLLKKDDEAIATYNEILKYYPDDAEVYYGVALVYINNKKDFEKGLQNMCKAYNIYVSQKSAYRSDAEKVINVIYSQMKKENKEDVFKRILKENNINAD